MSVFALDDETYAATYAVEAAMVDSAELIARALERSGMSRVELARKLGISRSEVTARLRGERNITIRKLAETLHALGEQLDLGCRPLQTEGPEVSDYLEWRSAAVSAHEESPSSRAMEQWAARAHAHV